MQKNHDYKKHFFSRISFGYTTYHRPVSSWFSSFYEVRGFLRQFVVFCYSFDRVHPSPENIIFYVFFSRFICLAFLVILLHPLTSVHERCTKWSKNLLTIGIEQLLLKNSGIKEGKNAFPIIQR